MFTDSKEGIKNQRTDYEYVNILFNQVYEQVIFSKTKYMIGVGFKTLIRTPVPKLPPRLPPPPPFDDKSVIFSIHAYFENKESPVICYKYNKPKSNSVINYIRLVTELDVENSIAESCDCKAHSIASNLLVI